MWLCSQCKKNFQTRSLLMLHCSSDCIINNTDTSSKILESDISITLEANLNGDISQDGSADDNLDNNFCDLFEDDSDADPTYDPDTDGLPVKKLRLSSDKDSNSFRYQLDSRSEDSPVLKAYEPQENSQTISQPAHLKAVTDVVFQTKAADEAQNAAEQSVGSEPILNELSANDEVILQTSSQSKKKAKKGSKKTRRRKKKGSWFSLYHNRKGNIKPAECFRPIEKCCRMQCYLKCTLRDQEDTFNSFMPKSKEAKHEILSGRISLSKKTEERKNRGKSEKTKNRQITVSYSTPLGTSKINVCKTMFCTMHGISRAQVNHLVKKLQGSSTGLVDADRRGKHIPKNKLTDEREKIKIFIDSYPRHISHYSRRESSEKLYLPSHLTIAKMYNEYKQQSESKGEKFACYDVFRTIFKSTGFKFKEPYTDTCKKCGEFKMKKRFTSNQEERDNLSILHDEHILEAEKGYEYNRRDKESAKENPGKRVLVFDLQQVLPSPFLSTNIAYYKRMLSTYNLTVRDCKVDEDTQCFMWHEAVGGRGSDQIASCVLKTLMMLPNSVKHVTTYSDTCGGQNRNTNIAIMFSYIMLKKPSLEIIDQKFLLPGHTRLECDSDHARIERAKKQLGPDMAIMTPRDWYSFVRMVSGKKRKFQVFPMVREDFLAFSKLLVKNILVKRVTDTNGEKVEWFKIKWLQYQSTFGVIKFKYTLDEPEPFRILDLRRQKRGRPITLASINIPPSYIGKVPINPLKKRDLLSMLSLIDEDCHEFYRTLPITEEAAEFDELEDFDGLDSSDEQKCTIYSSVFECIIVLCFVLYLI